jgi:branched-chain amino acid transport system ATP-binding protein
MRSVVEVVNCSAGYGDQIVVRDVSLSLDEREVLAVFGANGAGKSTVLRALLRTADIFNGSISILGRNISKLAPHEIPNLGVGALPQGGNVFPSLTVRENLSIALRKGGRDLVSQMVARAVANYPEISAHLDRPAAVLSGGERQILGICRAFVTDPRLVVLDEPGAGLPPGLLAKLLDRVCRAVREGGKGLLLVEHNASVTLALADKVVVLRDGNVVYADSARALSIDQLARLMLVSQPTPND